MAVLGLVACFDGRDALGLPCDADFQCGNGQVCAQGECVWPGDVTSTGEGSTGSSSTGSDPAPACVPGAAMTAYEIAVGDAGNPMAVGVGRVSDPSVADVVVGSLSDGRISVHRFDGVGAFVQRQSLPVDGQVMDVAVGPLDDDGFDDVAVATAGPDTVTIYWGGESDLSSDDASTYALQSTPHSIDVGNMGGDSALEILVSTGDVSNATSLLELAGRELSLGGSFAGVSPSPWDTAIVDLDGEAPFEALVAASNDESTDFAGSDVVYVLRDDVTFGAERTIQVAGSSSPYGADAGDIDGDGLAEVVVVWKNVPPSPNPVEKSSAPSEISLCARSSAQDDFACDTWVPAGGLSGFNNVRLGDLDCDGELDVVIGTSGTAEDPADGDLLVAFGPLEPGFEPQPIAGVPQGAVGNKLAIADATGDGNLDILVPRFGVFGSTTGTVRVFSWEVSE